MRGRWAVLAIVATALAASGSASAELPRQYGSMQFTATTPDTSTGNVLHVWFQNPSDPNAKPYAVQTMTIYRPNGTVIDTTAPPQCHATDAEIYLEGFDACPADTQLGSGFANGDQGPGASPRYSTTDLKQFNNQDEVVGIGVNEQISALKTIDRTKIGPRTSTSTFPLFPGEGAGARAGTDLG